MPQGYHHLKQEQRCQIYGLKKNKMVQQNIAAELGVSQATIMRRNAGKQGYRYGQAHAKAAGRKYAARGVCRKMTPANIIQIEKMLTEDQLSPEQISGRLKFIDVANIRPYPKINLASAGGLALGTITQLRKAAIFFNFLSPTSCNTLRWFSKLMDLLTLW